ncbi:MAG: hypothetical protein ABIH00_07065 [Armatimonadota bacterium]
MDIRQRNKFRIKAKNLVNFPTFKENTRDNYRLFEGYNECKKLDLEDFSDKVDSTYILFNFYGLILMITICIALAVFLIIVIFGNDPVFGLFMMVVPAGTYFRINFFKKFTNKTILY